MGAEHYKLLDQAVTVPSDATRAIGEAAKQAGLVVSVGVNERDGGTIYNAQLLFDADGTLIQHRRKISPTYHERMVWGQGDGFGLRCVDTAVGRIGQPSGKGDSKGDVPILTVFVNRPASSRARSCRRGAATQQLALAVPFWKTRARVVRIRLVPFAPPREGGRVV
jgi:Carbon-nitrogen hydrolase